MNAIHSWSMWYTIINYKQPISCELLVLFIINNCLFVSLILCGFFSRNSNPNSLQLLFISSLNIQIYYYSQNFVFSNKFLPKPSGMLSSGDLSCALWSHTSLVIPFISSLYWILCFLNPVSIFFLDLFIHFGSTHPPKTSWRTILETLCV